MEVQWGELHLIQCVKLELNNSVGVIQKLWFLYEYSNIKHMIGLLRTKTENEKK